MRMKISIRWALIAGFLGLIWGTHLITTTSSYLTSQEVLRRHARDIMENIAELAMEQSQHHLLHAHAAAALTRRLLASKVVNSSTEINALERYLHEQLLVNPHFAGIYIGNPSGNFYYVRRCEKLNKGGFETKIILNQGQGREITNIYRDQDFQQISRKTNHTDPYDPRERPWYIKAITAKHIVWTAPYIFYTSQKPGITIAGPFYDTNGYLMGVVGVDIEIDQLSVFIGNLKIGKNGKAFMLNRNADVVAFGDMQKLVVTDGSTKSGTRLAKIQELDDPYSRKAFETAHMKTDQFGALLIDSPQFSRFRHNGHVYHAMLTPFSTPQWPWIIGVYLPEDDYLGEIKANQFFNIVVTMVISLVAALIAILLARGVIRPISLMERTARKMKAGQTEHMPQIRSVYKEIQETANAFSDMKTAVERTNRKYLGIFNNIQDVYYEISLKGTLTEVSPSVEKVSQYKRNELIGKPLFHMYHEVNYHEKVFDILKTEKRISDYEVILKDKDGQLKNCALNSTILRTRSGKPYRIIGSLRDITTRKQAEQKLIQYQTHLEEIVESRTLELQKANDILREEFKRRRAMESKLRVSEERYRTILEAIDEIYFEADRMGNITYVNDAACRILGHSRNEILGAMSYRDIAERQAIKAVIRSFTRMVRTGDPIRVLTIETQTKYKEKKVFEVSAALIKDDSGDITGFRGLARDITSKIADQKEKENLQAWFIQAQRMEAVGTLAGGVAHDFNNLLMGIMGNASLIRAKSGNETNGIADHIQVIEQCAESGANLTRQLLGYARGGKYQVKEVDLNETIKRSVELFGRTRKEIIIDFHFQPDIWTVEADQGQIEQVLMNLYVNAWQAMEENKTLTVSTKNVNFESATDTIPPGLQPGAYVAIKVEDRGKGIAPEYISRIFEPFFTTKTMGRGTGLGLASAFGIVHNHDGIIDVTSTQGQGSIFTIYLPAVLKAPESEDIETNGQVRRGSGTLLVVDDETFVLKASTEILEELGYRTFSAGNGGQAIALFREKAKQIDAVLLDMIMPDLNGNQVLAEMRKIDPAVRVIRCSGYSLSDMQAEAPFPESEEFLQKPYTIEALSAVLNKVLEKDDPNLN